MIEREQYTLYDEGTLVFKEGVETIKKVEGEDRGDIKDVIINEGAKVIGGSAFSQCYELTAVSVPSTVVNIGSQAFFRCDKLADVQLPVGLLEIGNGAFESCRELADIQLPEGLQKIGTRAFIMCGKLPSDFIEKLPASVIEIARDAFVFTPLHYPCIAKSIELNDARLRLAYVSPSSAGKMIERESYTLYDEGKLVFKEGVETIKQHQARYTLYDEGKLVFKEGVAPPMHSPCIAKSIELNDSRLRLAYVSPSAAGTMIEREQYTLYDEGKLVFKEGVETIKKVDGNDKNKIKDVIINEGAKVIGGSAFSQCYELIAVSVPSTVVNIGCHAFFRCEKLADIQLPVGLLEIGREAFSGCGKLPSDFIEKLPASVTKIAEDAFKFTPLHDQCIAKSIELVSAKYDLDKTGTIITFKEVWLFVKVDLDETGTIVTFKEDVETIEGVARADKEKVVKIIIPEGAKVLAEKAFEGCKLLAAVTLPQTLEEIGYGAFCGCTKLPSDFIDKLPASVIYLAKDAFENTPLHVECVARHFELFRNCKNLRDIDLSHTHVVKIGTYAFQECSSLTSVVPPPTLKEVGYNAFNGCTKLESFVVPVGLECLENVDAHDCAVFFKCPRLTSLPGLLEASQNKLSMSDIEACGLSMKIDAYFLATQSNSFHTLCAVSSMQGVSAALAAATVSTEELLGAPAGVRLSYLGPYVAGRLPLHFLCGNKRANVATVKELVDALPQSMHTKDDAGKFASELAREAEAKSLSGEHGLIADVLEYLSADEVKEAETAADLTAAVDKKKSMLADSEGAIKRIRDDEVREQVTALQKQCFGRMLQEGVGAENEPFVKLRELSLKQAAVLADLIGECMTWYSTADRERYRPIELIENQPTSISQFVPPAAKTSSLEQLVPILLAQAAWKEPTFRELMGQLVTSMNSAKTVDEVCDRHGLDKGKWTVDSNGRAFVMRAAGFHIDGSDDVVKAKFGPPKGSARALVKLQEAKKEEEKGGKKGRGLKDLNRISLEFHDPLVMALMFECLKNHKTIKIVTVKNKFKLKAGKEKFEQPPDLHVNVDIGDGWLCEVQFLFKNILLIKKELHKFYDVNRAASESDVAGPLFSQLAHAKSEEVQHLETALAKKDAELAKITAEEKFRKGGGIERDLSALQRELAQSEDIAAKKFAAVLAKKDAEFAAALAAKDATLAEKDAQLARFSKLSALLESDSATAALAQKVDELDAFKEALRKFTNGGDAPPPPPPRA
ncbi:hypothetical protein TeGR_g6107 [Tetraparma gracilis]|uniref:Uncharacterized protein n=1 Tax=Tetraparma gracilis TaxID=2962635 RepID=A0ABQ6MQJ2_9STRA|nr:hypothetical protein TeGR_g6107 [Tetraparma gracilis]